MADYMTLKVLRVFLASPGDLSEERRAAKRAVDELDHTMAREFGWRIELCGWEDTLPGAGRPQELINRDVEACHLFVGLLWRRWGSPTGKFSSGFEEEFEFARARRSKTAEPEIWLCFKEVEAEQSKDPGEHLSSVLAFKEERIHEKDVMFKDFRTPEDWERGFRGWLLTHVAKLVKQTASQAGPPQQTSSRAPRRITTRLPSQATRKLAKPSKGVPRQLTNTMRTFSAAVRAGKLSRVGPAERVAGEFELARLSL